MYRLDFFFEDNSDIARNSNDLDTTSNRLERPVLSGMAVLSVLCAFLIFLFLLAYNQSGG